MLDANFIRKNSDKTKEGIKRKKSDPRLVDEFLRLDGEWRTALQKLEEKRREQKRFSAERNIESAKKNKEEIKILEEAVEKLVGERAAVWVKIPNLPSSDTPLGSDESQNQVLRKWGEPTKFSFRPKDHMELGSRLGIIDTERAAKVSGARFGYLFGGAAMLELALVQYAFSVLQNEKIIRRIAKKIGPNFPAATFIPVIPPVMIRPEVYRRTARLDPGQEDERYHLTKDGVFLIGSAEHTLVPLHMDETLEVDILPRRYVGFSTCFRREAGSHGKDVKGILRVHQFDKVEMESFTLPELARSEQNFFVAIQEYLMQSLGLPYQVVAVCTGDMGAPDERQIDLETWLPGQNQYRETHSADLIGEYQPRRLNTKFRRPNDETGLVHANDATVFAIQRMIIAILENYQTESGTVKIPKILQKYVGQKEIKFAE